MKITEDVPPCLTANHNIPEEEAVENVIAEKLMKLAKVGTDEFKQLN